MEVLHGCSKLDSSKKRFLALGTFDGVHLGHQKIIRNMVTDARAVGGESVVVTFSNHPRLILKPEVPLKLLTSNLIKTKLIEALGVDLLVFLEFNRRLADMEPFVFVRDVLVSCFKPSKVYVGYNYTFGNNGAGSPESLKKFGEELGFSVKVMDPICIDEQPINSTFIRRLTAAGDIEGVYKYLGRWPIFHGKVIHGKGLGSKLGYPTANLMIDEEIQLPMPGVYFGKAQVENDFYDAVANIGTSPTIGKVGMRFEVHLLQYRGNLYCKELTFYLKQRIRDEKKFSGVEDLAKQIEKDIARVSLQKKD